MSKDVISPSMDVNNVDMDEEDQEEEEDEPEELPDTQSQLPATAGLSLSVLSNPNGRRRTRRSQTETPKKQSMMSQVGWEKVRLGLDRLVWCRRNQLHGIGNSNRSLFQGGGSQS